MLQERGNTEKHLQEYKGNDEKDDFENFDIQIWMLSTSDSKFPLFVFWLRTGQTTRMPVSFSVYCDIHKFHAMPIPAGMLLGNLARSFPLQVLAHAMVNAIICGLANCDRFDPTRP